MRINRKLSALVLSLVFASMQLNLAATIDTGLGAGNGGASIIDGGAGFAGIEGIGTGNVDLNFNGNSHVQWDTLNVNGNEALNFNAVNGANNLTILNTVNNGMSNIYGQINANSGIAKLIISNPNGMLFDGAKFTTAGDAIITTQAATMGANGMVTFDPTVPTNYTPDGTNYVMTIKNSEFKTGGDLHFIAPTMNVVKSAFGKSNNVGTNNVRFTTTNGQDYFVTNTGCSSCTNKYTETQSMRLEAIKVDGDVYIVSDKGVVKTVKGGTINGNLNLQSNSSVSLNYVNNGNELVVTGDVNATANGARMYARSVDVKGNLNMENGGGYLEVKDVKVGKDMNLTTTAKSENPLGYKHFTHVNGVTDVKGDVNINSENNIHIGNYDYDAKQLLDGNLSVGGTLNAHANNGHVMTTINVQADKINMVSDRLNVLSSDDAVLTANEYSFKSNGYIGALKDYQRANGTPYTKDEQVIDLMETYTLIPKDIKSHDYMKIAGGEIKNIEAPQDAQVYIGSYGDVKLTGANAGDINITAYNKYMTITGENVRANNINVGDETNTLKLDFEGRNFTTNYTNIRDGRVVTIRPDEVITYELTDEPTNGYNSPDFVAGEHTTYLVGPGAPGPEPTPDPDPTPNPTPGTDDTESSKLLHNNWAPDDVMTAPVNTPVAFAADLDDDDEAAAVRKNVDGSVTVVRAFPMIN